MAKKNGGKNKPQRVRIKNKRATFDYEVIDKFMAGHRIDRHRDQKHP